uniref:Sugar phosphate transporter domain-containing protein n=1 Tax=Plectus sambesii TaxID=2011161 RepID=A0A914WA94_9BILA
MKPNMEAPVTTMQKVSSAVFFGVASIVIVFINKIVLTNYGFPSFLFVGLGQMAATIIVLFFGRMFGIVSFPKLGRETPGKIFPLPLIYVVNLVTGLGGTQKINLPMFTVLRRFSIFMTMVLEFLVLGVRAPYAVRLSVGLMILGSFIAAIYDLSFDAYGYTLIFINDLCTAANGVYMKQKLDAKDLGKYGLLFYNSFFMILPALLLSLCTDDFDKSMDYFKENGTNMSFMMCFLLSCVCGFILNYATVLCTQYNSALTTTCVGPIKNLFVTYGGMMLSGDYIFHWTNFIGINVSVAGSILYTYVTFRSKQPSPPSSGKQRLIVKSPQSSPLLPKGAALHSNAI